MENRDSPVVVCAWSNTVKYDGEWISFENYLKRRFGVTVTHGMSPDAAEKMESEMDARPPAAASPASTDAVSDPRRLRALRSTGLLDTPATEGFDRITRLGAALLGVPATFISLVDDARDFYVSHCGFGEPLASERQLTGQTFCHFTIRSEQPLVIPDTRADPVFAKVPTVESLGVAAYLGAPLTLLSGEVIGAFCAIDFAPHQWTESEVRSAVDLASLVVSEIELRQAVLDFQRTRAAVG